MKTNIAVDIRELEELVEHLEQLPVPCALSWQRFIPDKPTPGETVHQLTYQYLTKQGVNLKLYFQKRQSPSRLFNSVKYKLTVLVDDKTVHPDVGDVKFGLFRNVVTKIFRDRFAPVADKNAGIKKRYYK